VDDPMDSAQLSKSHKQDREQPEPGEDAVTVRVARTKPNWTGHELTEIAAESAAAAQHWDERLWHR
jgi:hypothetical protein